MSWFRWPKWLKRSRRRGARPEGVGREITTKAQYIPFDALVEELREQVGEAQERANAHIEAKLRRQVTLLDNGEISREDLYFHLPADGAGSPAMDLPLASLLYQRIPAVTEVALTLDASLIRKPGPEPGYAFVFGSGAEKVSQRKLNICIKMSGNQPGHTDVLIDGHPFKTIEAGATTYFTDADHIRPTE